MKRRRGSRLGQSTLSLLLVFVPALAFADARDGTNQSAGSSAELFALGAFVLLALVAHLGARRQRRGS